MATKKKLKKSPVRKPKKHSKPKRKLTPKRTSVRKKTKAPSKPKVKVRRPASRGRADAGSHVAYERRGMGARSGGQAGDTQGLAGAPGVDSESVEQLLEEGQSFEAEVLEGVENAPDPDQSEVRTRQVAEDDVPEEYLEKD